MEYSEALTISILCAFVSIPIAHSMSLKLYKSHPEFKPYTWGYFNGISGMLTGLTLLVWLFFFQAGHSGSGRRADEFAFFLGLYYLTIVALHFLFIKRNRWGILIAIIFQLNPVMWIINGIYLKNRWSEMGSSQAFSGLTAKFEEKRESLSVVNRALIAGTVFWGIAVLAFIFVFEPYGSRMNDREWKQALSVLIFPPAMAYVAYFIWVKFVK